MRGLKTLRRFSIFVSIISITFILFSSTIASPHNITSLSYGSQMLFLNSDSAEIQIHDGIYISNLTGNQSQNLVIKLNMSVSHLAYNNDSTSVFYVTNVSAYNGNVLSFNLKLVPGFYEVIMKYAVFINRTYLPNLTGNISAVIIGTGNVFTPYWVSFSLGIVIGVSSYYAESRNH